MYIDHLLNAGEIKSQYTRFFPLIYIDKRFVRVCIFFPINFEYHLLPTIYLVDKHRGIANNCRIKLFWKY